MLQYFDIHLVKYSTSATPAVTTSTNGLVRSSTSQTGVTTTFAYDAFQREVSQTDGRGSFHVVSFEGGGFAVTSGDTEIAPILAYSEDGEFGNCGDRPF